MGRTTIMNKITNDDLLSQVNPENLQLLEDFKDYLRSIQRSEGTINGYDSDIKIAWVWCLNHNNNEFFCSWTKRQALKYQNWLINNNQNSPARIKRLKAALSSLSNFVESILDDEYPNFRNIIKKIESPVNQPTREKTIFTEEQINGLLEILVQNRKYDQACALSLALCSGKRKSELLRLKISDFQDSNLVCGDSLYKSSPIKTKGRGIHGKQLECFCLAKKFKPYLDLWVGYMKDNAIDSEWLFPNRQNPNNPMGVSMLNSWANTFSNILDDDFYWHAVRHMTVTLFKRAGIPDSVIQQYMGWSDISMVPVYVDMDADEQLSMYFTNDGIVIPEQKSLSEL